MWESPAVVIGGGINALGIVRSLGSAQVPTFVLAASQNAPAMRSRFGSKVVVQSVEGGPIIQALHEVAREFSGRAVLFVTEEKTVRTISESRNLIAERFSIRMPPHDRLMALMHKQGFQDLAEQLGAAIPHTVRLGESDSFARVAHLRFPCVLKPAYKHYGYGAKFKKAYVVETPDEVARLFREIAPVLSDLIVQEWIEGDDSDIYFCLQYVGDEGAVCSFTGRKIRSWPPRIGGTASCTAAWDVADQLDAMTGEFFRQVGFVGMGSMEYKRDRRDGRFYMIEPTVARTDFQEEVATVNGVNIPFAAYCYERDLPLPPTERVTPPCVWREAVGDIQARRIQGAQGGEAGTPIRDALFRFNDPMPWVGSIVRRVSNRLGLGFR